MDYERELSEGLLGAAERVVYIFHADAAHGWLEVDRVEIEALGIADKITHYSYQCGDKVYLEEDLDAYTFLKEKYGDVNFRRFINFVERYADYSIIRSYPHYEP